MSCNCFVVPSCWSFVDHGMYCLLGAVLDSCAKAKHFSRNMLTMDDFTTVWELVIRSGNVDLLRTTLGGVDRAFYRFTRQLKFHDFFNLVFADILHVGRLLNQARGLPRSSKE